MKRRIWALALAACMALVAVGCNGGEGEVEDGPVLRVALEKDAASADVQKNACDLLALNIYDRLVESEAGESGETALVGGLAESWEMSSDGLVYTFHLRQGVLFHNGEELKASDVAYTFDRMLDPVTSAQNGSILTMIQGSGERKGGRKKEISGIRVLDEYTVEITLSKAYGPFLAGLATPAASIYNQKFCEEAGDNFGMDPRNTCGTGPFQLAEWTRDEHIVLTAFGDYWQGKPQLGGVDVMVVPEQITARAAFEAGDLDLYDADGAWEDVAYFEDSDVWGDCIVSGPGANIHFYTFNMYIEPLGDVLVRKALQMAVDRQEILDRVYGGRGRLINGVVSPSVAGYNAGLPEIGYYPDEARVLLEEAGYAGGFDWIIAQNVSAPDAMMVDEIVREQLERIGVRVILQPVEGSTWQSIRSSGDLPSYNSSWPVGFNDPDSFIRHFFAYSSTNDQSINYYNPDVQDNIDRARSAADPEERIAMYNSMEYTLVVEDAAWLPLFQVDHVFVVQPYVKGLQVPWNGTSSLSFYSVSIDYGD